MAWILFSCITKQFDKFPFYTSNNYHLGNNECKLKLMLITKQPKEIILWKALYAINCIPKFCKNAWQYFYGLCGSNRQLKAIKVNIFKSWTEKRNI